MNKPLALQVCDALACHVAHNSPEARLIDDCRREFVNGVYVLDLLERVCEAAAHLHRTHDLDCTASLLSALCNVQAEWSLNLENAIEDESRDRREANEARFGRRVA
jgi:hypothetical protein